MEDLSHALGLSYIEQGCLFGGLRQRQTQGNMSYTQPLQGARPTDIRAPRGSAFGPGLLRRPIPLASKQASVLLMPLQNGWGRDSARARGAPLAHSPDERRRSVAGFRVGKWGAVSTAP